MKACQGLAGASQMGASTCRVSGGCVRRNAISRGVMAAHDNQYRPGKGKIRICRPAESRASRHALEWILRTGKNSKLEFFTCWYSRGDTQSATPALLPHPRHCPQTAP